MVGTIKEKQALLLESDPQLAQQIKSCLAELGYSVLSPATTEEALQSLKNQRIELAFLGNPPDRDSCFDLLKDVVKASPMTYVVLITDGSEKEIHDRAEGFGILGHIPRVFSSDRVQQVIDRYLQITQGL
jgi:DNA-binding NtrC family response regulator